MTILVYGEKASRTHENQSLQAFLGCLEPRWATSSDWIFVIANAMWNGAEIDLVCILPTMILVADFKAYGGEITGGENGPWQADGVLVKGGSKANPFQQLRDNKFSVLDWLKSRSLLPGRNLGHIAAAVLFSRGIDDRLDLPPKVRSWFYPTDLCSSASLLDALASPELKIDRKEAEDIVQRLGATPLDWAANAPWVRDLPPALDATSNRTPLTGHQREALQALHAFVEAKDPVSFSVTGMTSTGKSRLLADLVTQTEKTDKPFIVLAPNRRLAWRAKEKTGIEMDSIYGHLYPSVKEGEDGSKVELGRQPKVIPLRENMDPENCVYVLDDAHLLGNSRFTTLDGKQYGSGQLLSDFFEFAKLGSSSRKVIFFGDPYQIQRAADESVLSGEFQKSRHLKHQSLELEQLVDTKTASAKLLNAERLVTAIRSRSFASLDLAQGEGLRLLDNRIAAVEVTERFRDEPMSAWYLAETHGRVNDFSQWLRKRLRGTAAPGCLEVGDLLEIYVGPEIRNAEFPAGDRRLHSGDRHLVTAVGRRVQYRQELKGREGPIVFHSVDCEAEGIEGLSFAVFEEFLTSEKPELDADTAIAERVKRAARRKRPANMQGELDSSRNDTASEPPLPDFAYVRHGYASTVHHAQGMARPICYVNCDHSASRHSESFFRWLYSALTVAEHELVLLNFADIHPFDEAEWNAKAVTVASDIAVGAGWSIRPDGAASEEDQRRELPRGLSESPDPLKSAAIWLRIAKAVERQGWRVLKATCHPYVEQYELAGPQGEQCQLRVAYNGKNVVTAMHVREAALWTLLFGTAQACIESNSYSAEAESVLRSARNRLAPGSWKVVSASETAYRLSLALARTQDQRVAIEINFDKQGLVSSLRPHGCSDVGVLEEIRVLLL
jgi:hypothetical protein